MRILSYNIQAGINSSSYWSYSYQWPRQFLPTPAKVLTLKNIAEYINDFDVVCLQEVELGGLRNGFKNQQEQLLAATDFPYSLVQMNRRLSKLSLHGNLILSKTPIQEVLNAPLPSRIPGRGILVGKITLEGQSLCVGNIHLSLGRYDQIRQLRFIRQQLNTQAHVLLTGDFNCESTLGSPLQVLIEHGYQLLDEGVPTFPSWKAKKTLDHALLKSAGQWIGRSAVGEAQFSDHLPLEISLTLQDAKAI